MSTLFKYKNIILRVKLQNNYNSISGLFNVINNTIRTPILKQKSKQVLYINQHRNSLISYDLIREAAAVQHHHHHDLGGTTFRYFHTILEGNRHSKKTLASNLLFEQKNIRKFGFKLKFFSKMSDCGVFEGTSDRFNGITIDSEKEFSVADNFEEKLKSSLDFWKKNKKRAIWFKVQKEHSEWIPQLTKNNFNFHHVKNGYVMLYRWLPENEYENLPVYAHTMVGVGGLVVNMEKREVLVVTDRFAAIPGSWKLPGGYVEPGENLIDAAIREVLEETSINSIFRTVVSLRHAHGGGYGCSDLYFVVALSATSFEPKACEREIARVQWLPFDEYLEHPHVHETNRHFLRTFLDYENRGLRFGCKMATHQILKKEYCLYDIEPLEDDAKANL